MGNSLSSLSKYDKLLRTIPGRNYMTISLKCTPGMKNAYFPRMEMEMGN